MGNPHKGELSFEVDGKSYKLSFSANALCELEDALGKSLDEIISAMQSGKVRLAELRVMFWQALRDEDPERDLDFAKALLRKMPPPELGRLVGEAFVRALPDEESAPASPPKPGSQKRATAAAAPRGTGPAS
jgi:hypothetical protein